MFVQFVNSVVNIPQQQQKQQQKQQQHQQNYISNDMKILYIEILPFFLHCINIFLNLPLMPLTNI